MAVLFGGRSGEHEVSLASAASVMRAINREKYDVVPIGISKSGQWLTAGDPLKALVEGCVEQTRPLLLQPDASRPELALTVEGAGDDAPGAIDVVFPVLHGPMGEDGTVQGLLEMFDRPYVGAGVLSSAVSMDKEFMKERFRAKGLPIARYEVIRRFEWERSPDEIELAIEARFGYPCFAKPANLGSSVGVSKVRDRAELRGAVAAAARLDRKIIVEEFVDAREIECSVLGNEEPHASLPGEIVFEREFYDYEAKYVDEGSRMLVPADLPADLTREAQRLAIAAFKAVDCEGMARVDFFLRRSDNQLLLNEINTIPGFTDKSMYARMWQATGLEYSDLVDRLIQLALMRHAEKHRYDSV